MRTIRCASGLAILILLTGTGQASAWDKCHESLSVRGHWEHSMRAAMDSAREQWQVAAAGTFGRRFSDWWYSGDRSIACSWTPAGTKHRCVATARACGRARA